MNDEKLKFIVEGLLMASTEPLSIDAIFKIVKSDDNQFEIKHIQEIVQALVCDYAGRGVELKEVASGWRFQVRHDLSPWISKLWEERPPRYSRALLETLALIAYRQPITRAEIEDVRGVAVSSNIIKTLLDHDWVKIAGFKEVPGRPALFVTTKKFLDHFNLQSLQDLPPLVEFTDAEAVLESINATVQVQAIEDDVAAQIDAAPMIGLDEVQDVNE